MEEADQDILATLKEEHVEGTTLDVLTEQECYRLLRQHATAVGRVGVSVAAVPEILPVNFAMIDKDIVFRTGRGTKLHTATDGAVLAFEVDDADDSSGWSVLVIGRSTEVTEAAEVVAALAVIADGWVPGEHEHVVRITPFRVSGRRIHRQQ